MRACSAARDALAALMEPDKLIPVDVRLKWWKRGDDPTLPDGIKDGLTAQDKAETSFYCFTAVAAAAPTPPLVDRMLARVGLQRRINARCQSGTDAPRIDHGAAIRRWGRLAEAQRSYLTQLHALRASTAEARFAATLKAPGAQSP